MVEGVEAGSECDNDQDEDEEEATTAADASTAATHALGVGVVAGYFAAMWPKVFIPTAFRLDVHGICERSTYNEFTVEVNQRRCLL